jgi:hypothetical protein
MGPIPPPPKPMTIPSHALLMASVEVLSAIEIQEGYQAAKQASRLMENLIERELQQLNAAAERRTRNEMKHCLRMLLRRDARLATA